MGRLLGCWVYQGSGRCRLARCNVGRGVDGFWLSGSRVSQQGDYHA